MFQYDPLFFIFFKYLCDTFCQNLQHNIITCQPQLNEKNHIETLKDHTETF